MTDPKIRIHSLAAFDRGAKARWLLTEMGVPYETRLLDRAKKENESPEYLRLNPMGRVPAVEIDDLVFFESGAICAYLADLYLDRGMAPKLATPERAKYEQWMYFAHCTVDPMQTRIMVIEDIPPGEVQKTKEAALQSDLGDACEAIDQALSKGQYLLGGRFSTADICISYHLYFLRLWPELGQVVAKFPRVTAYLDRMTKMPSAVKADVFSYNP
jgi:glutathione S-transferase